MILWGMKPRNDLNSNLRVVCVWQTFCNIPFPCESSPLRAKTCNSCMSSIPYLPTNDSFQRVLISKFILSLGMYRTILCAVQSSRVPALKKWIQNRHCNTSPRLKYFKKTQSPKLCAVILLFSLSLGFELLDQRNFCLRNLAGL